MTQRTRTFSAYNSEGLSEQINKWLEYSDRHNINVKIEKIVNITPEFANEKKQTDYPFEVLVLYSN